jgi:hypothetical protein
MIKLAQNTKVFVLCPGKVVTGGAELLHQLVHILNNHKVDAYMVYFDGALETPVEYQRYNTKIADIVIEDKQNIVVLYEAIFDRTRNYKDCQLLLWWLSVDHFFIYSLPYLSLSDYFKWDTGMAFNVIFRRLGYLFIKKRNYFKNNLTIKGLSELNVVNGYQSDYAKDFLVKNNFKNTIPLSDYINRDFYNVIADNTGKENIILYNPKKGLAFTKKLIEQMPHLTWIPLQGMTRQQLKEVFKKSKLYVDFGYHPGKDRIPREAVLNGCCVITGVLGSAGHYEDIPISDNYKIDQNKVSINEITGRIQDILDNYDTHIKNFEYYRTKTIGEEQRFEDEVLNVFSINNKWV